MIQVEHIATKNTLSKGLMAVILLLSLFTFSGNNTYLTHQQVTQTEVVVFARSSKRAFSISKPGVIQQQHRQLLHLNLFEKKTALRVYAQSMTIKFEHASNQFQSSQKSITFFRSQHIPRHSAEEDQNFLRG